MFEWLCLFLGHKFDWVINVQWEWHSSDYEHHEHGLAGLYQCRRCKKIQHGARRMSDD